MPPTLSTPFAVMTILSLVLGALTQAVQTGSVAGFMTPKSWLPWLTIATSFLGGAVGYLSGLSPLVLDGASIFYAVAAGVTALLSGTIPGIVVHAHFTIPRQIAAWRAANAAIQPRVGK